MKIKRTPRLKTKKTIRTKLKSPNARNLARISRNLHSIRRQIDTLVDHFESDYAELRALEKAGQHSKMKEQTAIDSARQVADLFHDSHDEPLADPEAQGEIEREDMS